ncbi:helix-turn-helix domain-containing protein [Streptomyces sp. NBC_01803]|uniref:helix-turn-helix domain-containing protein n=1 Tax=Streptomyces sp. NBC_01803 TaxID=2975946 RepID=UPI002DD9EBEE|nr:helix-turn-helix domain-containing protein [Streptomyces sp. NBC_01803]
MTQGPVKPELLKRKDLQDALIEHDFAAVFSLLKKWGGLSQNRIATACQLTPGKVSMIIKGTHQVTSYDVIARIADGLRIPGHMVGLTARPWETHDDTEGPPPEPTVPAGTAAPWTPAAAVQLAARMTRTDLLMDRRTASRSIATVTIGAALLDGVEGWLQPAAAGERRRVGRLGQREIEQLEEIARLMRQWDRQHGGGLRRRAVVGQLAEVADALREPQAEEIERRLYCVMADLAGTAAGMAWDSGMHRTAQDYYRLALRAAHAGDDRAFGANVLAAMARQMLYRDQDRPQDALELVRLAQTGARGVAGPRVRAMLLTREAWAYASCGRPAAFHRATEEAAETLADARDGEEPYWIDYFGAAELAGVTGGRLLDMARHEPARYAGAAAEKIRTAVEARGTEAARSHALDWAGLAECSWLMGDIRIALEQTHHAIDVAALTQSTQVRTKLGRLYPYTVGHSASGKVREARHRIRDLLST